MAPGDADGDIELRGDHLAGLADLVVVRRIAGVDRRAAGADRGAQLVGQGSITRWNSSAEPMARPPETTILAAASSGRSDLTTSSAEEAGLGRARRRRAMLSTVAEPPSPAALKAAGAHGDHLLGVGATSRSPARCRRRSGARRCRGVDHLDDLGDLRDVERGGDARGDSSCPARWPGSASRRSSPSAAATSGLVGLGHASCRARRSRRPAPCARPAILAASAAAAAHALAGDQHVDVAGQRQAAVTVLLVVSRTCALSWSAMTRTAIRSPPLRS